jgi:hypothetical protein
MRDFQDISQLSPAPRRTPTSVLWVMTAVVVAGSVTLVWSEPAAHGSPASQSVAMSVRYAAATPAARPSATSKQARPQAR